MTSLGLDAILFDMDGTLIDVSRSYHEATRMTAELLSGERIDDDEVIRRLSGRRTCRTCNHIWHVDFDPPAVPGVCDLDGSPLIVRDDDKPEVIRKRLETYHEKTEPLVSYYDSRSVLRRIEGEAKPEEVAEQIRRTLATLRMEQDETV